MSLDAEVQSGAAKAAKEANNFAPLPKGNYEVTIAKGEVKLYEKGAYQGKRYINLQLRVIDSAPVGKGRVVFAKVPLFSNWKPSAKYPDGYPTNYAEFFLALGVSDEQVDAGRGLPGPQEFGGKRLSVYVTVRPADDYNDSDYNEVSRISAPKGGTPSAVAEVAGGDVWGTADAPAPAPAEPAGGSVWDTPSASPALQEAAASTQGF